MSWLCTFFACRWQWVTDQYGNRPTPVGLWQCTRCKTLSIGRPKGGV